MFYKIAILILSVYQLAYAQQYVKVKAKSGDGIYSILGRYDLDKESCNFEQFCKINKLQSKSLLIEGQSYYLPVEKHTYNGKSIRSTVGMDDYRLAKQVEQYNDKMCDAHFKADHRKGKGELWCPHHIQNCGDKTDDFVPKEREYPIFGSQWSQVRLQSKQLAGAVYYIVSGHGGPDPGAIAKEGKYKICEDEYAYDISLRLGWALLSHGAIVHFITRDKDGIRSDEILECDDDEFVLGDLKIPMDQKERLNQRSDIINSYYAQYKSKGLSYQRTIEIHVDSRNTSERIDLFFYHHPDSKSGAVMAKKLLKTMKEKYAIYRKSGVYTGTVSERALHILRNSLATTIFIELANIQNASDRQRILIPKNRQLIADWLLEGIMKDYD
jgi:N-acetylmuramoyl-L-alanine amidase